ERERLVGKTYADVPGPVALVRNAIRESTAADRLPPDRCRVRAVEVAAGAEGPIAGITRDQHADAARKHAARHGEGEIASGEPAVRTGVQNRRRVPFLDANGPLVVNRVRGLAVDLDKAQVAFDDIPVWQGEAPIREKI